MNRSWLVADACYFSCLQILQNMYRRTADDTYIQALPGGDVIAFRTKNRSTTTGERDLLEKGTRKQERHGGGHSPIQFEHCAVICI